MFDVAAFDTRTASEAGVAMEILHPRTGAPMLDDEGKPVTVTMLGPNSKKSRDLNRTMQLRRTEMAGRGVEMSEGDFDTERTLFLTGVTVGWTFGMMDGQAFPFTPENAARLWADKRWGWVASQAWRFAQSEGNFLPSPSGG